MARRIAQVHPQQLGGEQRRLLAAGPGAHLEDHVAVVVRVARQQQDLEFLEQPGLVAPSRLTSSRAICGAPVAVAGVAHLAGTGELLRVAVSPVRLDDRLEPRELATEPSHLVGIGVTSGRDSSAWRSSYCAAISASLASRSLMPRRGGSLSVNGRAGSSTGSTGETSREGPSLRGVPLEVGRIRPGRVPRRP